MAVMASQLSEGVAFEQKIQPVPSSDKMALDLDINGFSNRDESNAASDINLTTNDPPAENTAMMTEVNGSGNLNAFASNQIILETPIESQATAISPSSAPNSSQLFDTNTSTSEAALATSPGQVQSNDTLGLAASETAIEAAVEDSTASSSIPPVVEAQESDLRDTNSHFAPDEPTSTISKELSDTVIETESSPVSPTNPAQGPVTEQLDLKIENNTSSAVISNDMDASASSTVAPEPSLLQEDAKSLAEEQDQNAMQIDAGELAMEFDADNEDTHMTEAPPAKIAREREDDDEIAPSAKRAKTDDSMADHLTDEPATFVNGNGVSAKPQGTAITEYQAQEMMKVLKAMAVRGHGKNFKGPVAELWPTIAAAYLEKIPNPIDLRTMVSKIDNKLYHTMEELKDDARLLHENAVTFNGHDHVITKAAAETRKSIEAKISSLPAAPTPPIKKEKKKRPVPSAGAAARAPAPPSRRQSSGSQSNTVPVLSEASQTYALPPSGVPAARRGSVMNRPKREIHPPKNKDLSYTARPKNKKIATELKFCEEVLAELNKPKHIAFSGAFAKPVDPVALGIPAYFNTIKKPMDLSTISRKLKEGSYTHASDFERDIRLMLSNCFKFNPPANIVHTWGRQLETLFNEQWERKDQWMSDHAPAAASPASVAESEEEDEEDDEEDAADGLETTSTMTAARDRLLEEQQKLIEMMSASQRNESLISMQKQMVEIVKKSVHEAEMNAKKPKVKKAKAPKAVKKVVPVKKASAPTKKLKKTARYMGTLEKETISNGLGSLPDHLTTNVLEWIQNDQGNLAADSDGQFELDIDVISTDVLWKIYDLIMEVAPEINAGLKQSLLEQGRESPQVARPAPKKKNKPMTKTEQERKIDQIKGTLESFKKAGSQSQEPVMPTVEHQDPDTSGDEDSDSEEE